MGDHNSASARVLVTGASGYVGGRLVPALEARGERVRCLARTPRYLQGRFSPATEIVRGATKWATSSPRSVRPPSNSVPRSSSVRGRSPSSLSAASSTGQRLTYGELMREYARQIGVRRLMIPVPFLSPRLSSLWLGLMTPLYARVGRKLIDSLRNDTVVHDRRALDRFPVRPLAVGPAIGRALLEEDRELARTRWSDAVSGRRPSWGGRSFGSRLIDRQQVLTAVEPADHRLRPLRPGGTGVLVRPLSGALADLSGHAQGKRAGGCCGTAGGGRCLAGESSATSELKSPPRRRAIVNGGAPTLT